jgi:hypothetical protein
VFCSRRSLICGLLLGSSIILAASARASSFGPSGNGVFGIAGDGNPSAFFEVVCGSPSTFALSPGSCSAGTVAGFASDGTAYSDSASASSSLAAGALSVEGTTIGSTEGEAQSFAKMSDTLYFSGGTPYEVGTITMTATGTHSGSGVVFMTLGEQFLYGGSGGVVSVGCGAETGFLGSSLCPVAYGGIAVPLGGTGSSDGTNLSVTLTFPLFSSGVDFLFSMQGVSAGDGSYSYTDPITLTLPAGVTYTSDSGEFLTGTATGVPEPSTFVLLFTGIVMLFADLRRKGSLNGFRLIKSPAE